MRRAPLVLSLVSLLVPLALPARAAPAGVIAVPVATGLDYPAAFAFAPDGRIFYGQAFTGQIHVYDPSTGTDSLFFTIAGDTTTGLLGLALAPGYPVMPWVYAYVSRDLGGIQLDQLVRVRDVGGIGSQARIVFQTDAGTDHFGGPIRFGADGMLFLMVGDGGDPASSQDPGSPNGKVLRMTPTGQPAPGNPFGASLVWAYGLRNSLGTDFDPQTGRLWETENGPECNDEMNLIREGRNYGWGPSETCSTPPPPPRNTNQDGPHPVPPAEWIAEPTAPTGMAFCQGCGLAGAEGTFLYGNYNLGEIHMVTLTANRRGVASDAVLYTHSAFVLSMEQGPDGSLYFSDGTAIYRLAQA